MGTFQAQTQRLTKDPCASQQPGQVAEGDPKLDVIVAGHLRRRGGPTDSRLTYLDNQRRLRMIL